VSKFWLFLIASLFLAGGIVFAQSDSGAKRKQDADTIYIGVANCAGCHSKKSPSKFSTEFVLMNEYDTWHKEDKHSQAYEVLENSLGKRILENLDDPAKKNACLNCHTVNIPAERQGSHFRLQDGVSCEACHGPAKKWLGDHQEYSWRLKTGSEKAALGMIDMRNRGTQARLCLSCHLGNAAEGKILTHGMLAAGHPPLPGFEITAFHQFMPRHWRLAKNVPFLQDPKLDKPPAPFKDPLVLKKHVHDLYQLQFADFEQTQMAVRNGIAVFQTSIQLLAEEARTVKDQGILDLAMFQCSSCHHELKKNNQPGAPARGRPRAPTWPAVLVPMALRHIAGPDQEQYTGLAKEYADQLRLLRDAVLARPFGDPRKMATSADKLAAWAGRIQDQAAKTNWDRQSARRLLDELGVSSQQKELDYDSARQIAWTYRTIQKEVFPEEAKGHVDVWKVLDRDMRLTIRPGKYLIEEHLTETFERIGKFDPAAFGKSFRGFGRGK